MTSSSSLFQLNFVSRPSSTPILFKLSVASSPPSSCFGNKYHDPGSFGVSRKEIPARDRVIGLGKYKGKMLGSLPSSYLKWVSKNLRAGDTEEWARLADQVLGDPVYRDRIEWEMVEKILNGNENNNSSSSSRSNIGSNAVSELLEISGRFGWDNEDKQGWSKIDFGLLGTSRGGRIPRLAKKNAAAAAAEEKKIKTMEENVIIREESGGRRRERRERMMRRRRQPLPLSLQQEKAGMHHTRGEGFQEESPAPTLSVDEANVEPSRFPGRQALLEKLPLLHRLHRHSISPQSGSST